MGMEDLEMMSPNGLKSFSDLSMSHTVVCTDHVSEVLEQLLGEGRGIRR